MNEGQLDASGDGIMAIPVAVRCSTEMRMP